jgi:hypothetical protein
MMSNVWFVNNSQKFKNLGWDYNIWDQCQIIEIQTTMN